MDLSIFLTLRSFCSLRVASLLFVALCLPACATEEPPPTTDDSSEEIVNGEQTQFWPAVGVTTYNGSTGCSGTLVAANVVLLAGHCFEPGRTDIKPWKFRIQRGGRDYDYETDRGWLYVGANGSRSAGEDDIALLRLKSSVPSSVARPLQLATDYPENGAAMQMIGYGCTDRNTGAGGGVKRRATFAWGDNVDGLCPGDSGGALIEAASGRIVGVNSGFYGSGNGDDIFAWVPKHYDDLRAQIETLRR